MTVADLCDLVTATHQDVVNVTDAAVAIVAERAEVSHRLAAEWVDTRLRDIRDELQRRHNREVRRGVPPAFDVVPEATRLYLRMRGIETTSGAVYHRDVLSGMQGVIAGLDDGEFEALGALLLDCYDESTSVRRAVKTRRGGDAGFDFVGWWSSGEDFRLEKEFNCRIAGQAKAWSARVPLTDVQQFAFRLRELRRGHLEPRDVPRDWLNGDLPVLGFFLAKSGFQRTCYAFAREEWIVLVESDQVAWDLVRAGITDPDELRSAIGQYLGARSVAASPPGRYASE